ncbi:uncharacterized protein BT62DRAFT_983207 [Guyanagaster necrorhizus]|uniref:Uncharacterized protein n=1 Tax=Guyanagaster necrorhizus TaxID=856835 RepID=A0A9P8AMS3_9AGAR|nr:uncharacterized protein BT62DRAFT_983207 [Guyanagaster necrorhizus MCA 3950]KAG7440122.1 hypothetical protein BT62DRAFT_983207 [Guyanagaster necrorhizus MCA 3950]
MPSPFILVRPASRGLSFDASLAYYNHLAGLRDSSGEPETLKQKIISQLDVDPARLNILPLDLGISCAAESLAASLKSPSEASILHTEKQPQDLDLGDTKPTFDINFISHLLPIKTLFPLLPFAALNQVVKTFDLHLAQKNISCDLCWYASRDLSKEFWGGVREDKLFEPGDTTEKAVRVVNGLGAEHRGRIWDWA